MKFFTSIVGFLIFLEFFSRFIYRSLLKSDRFRDSIEAINYILSPELSSPNRKFTAKPYSLYWNAKFRENHGVLQTDINGYRLTKHYELFDGSENLILVLGGSTTFGDHHSKDPNETWVSAAQNFLINNGVPNFRLINAGLNYATSAELLAHYVFVGQHLNPSIVILDGPGNDFLPVAFGDLTTDYSNTRVAFNFQKRKYEKIILKSYFIKLIYTKLVTSANLVHMEPNNFVLGNTEKQNQNLLDSNAAIYQLNVATLGKLCNMNKTVFVAIDFLRPSLTVMKKYYPLIHNGLFLFNKKCSEVNGFLASKLPLFHHINLDSMEDKYFVDSCHLSKEGELIKGERVAQKILEIIALQDSKK